MPGINYTSKGKAFRRRVTFSPWAARGVRRRNYLRVLDHFDDYYPAPGYRHLFEALGRPGSPSQGASRVFKIVKKLRNDRALAEVK
jgi:hypothetical protein